MGRAPQAMLQIKLTAVSAFSSSLRRYTSLNHLAQAARAVLHNGNQIGQMLADLNRVDFHSVREQASWVNHFLYGQNLNIKITHCLRCASVITRSCLDSKTILNWLCNSKILWSNGHLGWKTWSKAPWNLTRVGQVFLRPPGNFFWNGASIGKCLLTCK